MKIAILAAALAVSGATALGAQTATGASSGTAGGSSDGMSSGMTGTNSAASTTSSGTTGSIAAGNASAAGSGVTGASGTGTTLNGVSANTAGSTGTGGAAAVTTSTGQAANTAGTDAAAPVGGATTAPATAAAIQMQPMPAQDFVLAAASGGLFEVESSKLALERSKSDAVKQFAQMMIADHSKANDELKAIATGAKLEVPAAPAGAPASHLKAVQDASDADFDRTYLMHQDQAHAETLALFTAQAGATSTPELAAFAAKTLPTLKMHADHVKKLVK